MILALGGALLIGISLGLLGSGGSVPTVPVLVYLVGQEEKVAIAGAMAIVGTVALFASIPYARGGLVDTRSLVFFGVPSMAGAYLGAFLSTFVAGTVQLVVFAVLMFVAAALMLRPPHPTLAGGAAANEEALSPTALQPRWAIVLEGLLVGTITGFVGVGGGFLIVPALVILGRLEMHRAVGTSLCLITVNSAVGFLKYLQILHHAGQELDYGILGLFSLLGIGGSFLGKTLGRRLPQATLKRGFGFFLILIAAFILYRSWATLHHAGT